MSATEGNEPVELSLEQIGEVLAFIDTLDLAEVDLTIGDVRLVVRKRGGADASLIEERAGHEMPATEGQSESDGAARPRTAPEPIEVATVGPDATDSVADDEVATWLAREAAGEVTIVRSPMVGTFYRAKEPGAPPFVEPGLEVEPDDVVCIVEVMKLFHSVTAGASGVVRAVLVQDSAVVEHGQPLVALARA